MTARPIQTIHLSYNCSIKNLMHTPVYPTADSRLERS